MVIYERLEILPSYSALNTFHRVRDGAVEITKQCTSCVGNGQNNCHPGQSLYHCQKDTVHMGEGGREDVQGGSEL